MDRWNHAKKQADLFWEGRIKRFPGIKAEYGCRKSHMALIEKAYNDNLPFILIAEDDFTLPDEEEAASRFRTIFEQLPEDWYCLKMGSASPNWERITWLRHSEDLMQNAVKGCFFYMLSRDAIKDCVENKHLADKTTDQFISSFVMPKAQGRCFLASPMLAYVSEDFETTRTLDPGSKPTGIDYHNNCKQIDAFLWTFFRQTRSDWSLNDAALDKILSLISEKKNKIVEFGAGWTTTMLRSKGAKLLSFEDNADYLLPSLNGSQVVHATIKNKWYDRKIVDDAFDAYFDYWRRLDILIIDGPYAGKRKQASRMGVIEFIEKNLDRIIDSETWLVIDDTNRPKDYALVKQIKQKWTISVEEVHGADKRTTHFLKLRTKDT